MGIWPRARLHLRTLPGIRNLLLALIWARNIHRFSGLMDEVAIFNQALSAQQIQQAYSAFSGGMCKPTLQSIAVTPVSPSIAAGLLSSSTL